MAYPSPERMYTPDRRTADQSILQQYISWLFVKKGLYFRDYNDLWDWSTTDLEDFWESIFQFFSVHSPTDYTQVVYRPSDDDMLGIQWFDGATVNYAEHIFRHKSSQRPALLVGSDGQRLQALSWATLEEQVASVAGWLRNQGVEPGDRVAAVLPNGPEAIVAFLATSAVGGVWAGCSPTCNTNSLIEKFRLIDPKILIVADGYIDNGVAIDKTDDMRSLRVGLSTLQRMVWLPYLDASSRLERTVSWSDVLKTSSPDGLTFNFVPFNDPVWVLFSAEPTDKSVATTHSVGGCLLEHLKVLALHQDVRAGERYFWSTAVGETMWYVVLGSMLTGATPVLYNGAVGYPDLNVLWKLADDARISHFGADAAFYMTCKRAAIRPIDRFRLSTLRSIGSTGVLPTEGFRWIYEAVKPQIWFSVFGSEPALASGFIGSNPLLPMYEGESQGRLLGCSIDSVDEQGRSVRDEPGELAIRQPMPSMPINSWNDLNGNQYRRLYFAASDGLWRNGDLIRLTPHNNVVTYGRSEAMLIRDGVRIGTTDIYSAIESLPEVADSLVVGLEQPGGRYFMPLFVVLRDGIRLTDGLIDTIRKTLRTKFSPRHVPDAIYAINEVPYTISGQKLESVVKKILLGVSSSLAAGKDLLRNPAALDQFVDFELTSHS